jgi:putative FmdB family regulatory protein
VASAYHSPRIFEVKKMPTYSYKCTNCGHRFDKEQRITESPLKECPVCAGEVRRVINQVGVVFKGTGFYVTDNRHGANANGKGKSEKKAEGTETTSSSEAAATTSTTSTEKPSTTAATTT